LISFLHVGEGLAPSRAGGGFEARHWRSLRSGAVLLKADRNIGRSNEPVGLSIERVDPSTGSFVPPLISFRTSTEPLDVSVEWVEGAARSMLWSNSSFQASAGSFPLSQSSWRRGTVPIRIRFFQVARFCVHPIEKEVPLVRIFHRSACPSRQGELRQRSAIQEPRPSAPSALPGGGKPLPYIKKREKEELRLKPVPPSLSPALDGAPLVRI